MKATIKYDLSKIMKTAWTIFKGNTPYSYSFAAALSRAWYVAKAAMKAAMVAGCLKYYTEATNRYYGD